MASSTELEKQIKLAQKDYASYKLEGDTATGKYTMGGKELNYYAWNEGRTKAKARLDKLLTSSTGLVTTKKLVSSIEEKNKSLLDALAKGNIKGDSAIELTNKTIEENNARLVELKSLVEQKITTPDKEVVIPKDGKNVVGTPGTTEKIPLGPYRPGTFGVPAIPTPTGPAGSTGPGGTGGGTKVGSTKIIGGVSNTWDGMKWVPEKKKVKVDWERKFREMFPSESWMLDLDRTKYADVFKLFQKSIDGEVYKTAEGQARFKAQLEGTSFVKELASTDKVRQVKNVVGDLGFDSMPFNSFLTKAMNMGWEGVTLKQEVYKEAFRKNDAGAFLNPTAITRAKASNDYLTVAKIGKSYFSTVADDTIQSVLTGGMAQQDVERQQRELAKTKYSHLSNLIEQGFTMEQLSSSFKDQTARILEKDPNAIDMSQSDYEQAFNFGEEGKKRMMSSGEWEIKLRSDPRYNWGSTQNAKDEARRLSASISQAFGKVI